MRTWLPHMRGFTTGRGLWNYSEELGAVALSNGLARLLNKNRVYDVVPKDNKTIVVVDCAAADAKDKISSDTNVQLVAGSWSGMMSALDGEVVASFESGITETNNSAVMMSLKRLQKLYDTPNATFYSIWLKDPNQLKKVMRDLSTKLASAGLKVELYPWTDEAVAPFYAGTMQFVYVMVGFITFVLALVVIFSIFNSATMTIIERSQEIGMMRSLGFRRRQIRQLFIMEMLLLSAVSVIGGGLIALIGILLVNGLEIHYYPPGVSGGMTLRLIPNFLSVGVSVVINLGLALITTLFAVWSVANRNIATLLLGAQR
jgi:putative ABC transport system permease protein